MAARLVIDAMNVIGSRPTGWWRDRDGAARELAERLRLLCRTFGDDVTLVLDGGPVADLPAGELELGGAGRLRVLYAARRGRDAADDRIVGLVEDDPDPPGIVVVTSDRALRDRVLGLGARTSGPGGLLRRLDGLD